MTFEELGMSECHLHEINQRIEMNLFLPSYGNAPNIYGKILLKIIQSFFSVDNFSWGCKPNCHNFPFPNWQNFLFQTVKISFFKLSKFRFLNCQNFHFQMSKFSFSKLSIFSFSKLSKFPCGLHPKRITTRPIKSSKWHECLNLWTPNFFILIFQFSFFAIHTRKLKN